MSATTRRASLLGAVAAVAVIAGLAFFASPFASTQPDGLNKVAADHGLDRAATDHPLDRSPTAGYETQGVDDEGLSKGVAGLIGVTVTFLAVGGLLLVVRRTTPTTPTLTATAPDTA